MFPLKSFIEAIQAAILNASDALMDKNIDLLNRYFEDEGESEEIKKKMDEAIWAADKVVTSDAKTTRQSLIRAVDSLKELKDALSDSEASGQSITDRNLQPKMVTVNYPTKKKVDGKDQIVDKEVQVPLLTLAPIAFAQVHELKLSAALELNLVEGEVQVGFGKIPRNSATPTDGTANNAGQKGSVGNIEIVIKAQEVSDGMQHIIDAYEKVLKAQLPL